MSFVNFVPADFSDSVAFDLLSAEVDQLRDEVDQLRAQNRLLKSEIRTLLVTIKRASEALDLLILE